MLQSTTKASAIFTTYRIGLDPLSLIPNLKDQGGNGVPRRPSRPRASARRAEVTQDMRLWPPVTQADVEIEE
jgi:hypothetical protein